MAKREQHTMWQEMNGTFNYDRLHPGKQDQIRNMTSEIRDNMDSLLEMGLPEPFNGWNFGGDIIEVVAKAYRIGQHDVKCEVIDRIDKLADEISGEVINDDV